MTIVHSSTNSRMMYIFGGADSWTPDHCESHRIDPIAETSCLQLSKQINMQQSCSSYYHATDHIIMQLVHWENGQLLVDLYSRSTIQWTMKYLNMCNLLWVHGYQN